MLKLARRAYAVFKAYFLSSFIRSRGFIYVLLSETLWIIVFILPLYMFMESPIEAEKASSYAFTWILIFMFYSIASWDWAAEIRWMINDGRIEYYIASGAGFTPHYLGSLPVTLIWLSISLLVNYLVLSMVWGPPKIVIYDPIVFITGFSILILVLLSYALFLGGTMISTGVTGFIVELISFILPIATGGLAPLRTLPEILQIIALLTPFSYPAELIRYSLLGVEPVIEVWRLMIIGVVYSILFALAGIMYFKIQLKKTMKTGFKTISMW